jgi:hypothetical protein
VKRGTAHLITEPAPLGYRPRVMRRLGLLAVVGIVLIGACGDGTDPGGEPDSEPRGVVGHTLVEVVTETDVGGMVSPGGVALADQLAVQQFAGQFDDDRMQVRLTNELADLEVPDDQAAYAAVVGIGCDVPSEVTVTSTDTGILIEPVKPSGKPVQCIAPATSVAIVLVDEAVVG